MNYKHTILAINGSASRQSSNLFLLKAIHAWLAPAFNVKIIEDVSILPPFKTEQTEENTPEKIVQLRRDIDMAAGIIICSPEYVFSIPSGLKNLIEWCVSTTVFSDKPVGMVIASAQGEKAYEELKMILTTLQAELKDDTSLLIQGIKGKIAQDGKITNPSTEATLKAFASSFSTWVTQSLNAI